jgi:hypothetical protein
VKTTRSVELDHAFVTCAFGAPEANALVRLGLVEGSSNAHLGQGTANRRFFFDNFMLEFLWVTNPAEVTSTQTQRTRLWERCSSRTIGINPFGLVLRPTGENPRPPFETWSYCPSYLPPGSSIQIATETTLQEPALFYLPFLQGPGNRAAEPTSYQLPLRQVSNLCIGVPDLAGLSVASRLAAKSGLVTYFESPEHVLEIVFEGAEGLRIDLRPGLPFSVRVHGDDFITGMPLF